VAVGGADPETRRVSSVGEQLVRDLDRRPALHRRLLFDHCGQHDDEVCRQILQPRLAAQGGHRGNDLLDGSIGGRGDMIT
jgi:hypothetical protein